MGIHLRQQASTPFWIVKNGACDYKVLIPARASALEKKAAEEFVYFFKRATDVELEILTDESCTNGRALFSVGRTNVLQDALRKGRFAVDFDALKSNGARVITYDKTVFAFGATGRGTLYAVYEYLQSAFGFDYFTKDVYTLTKSADLPFFDLDITEVPDIELRTATYACVKQDGDGDRYRMIKDFAIPIEGSAGHNALKYLGVSENLSTHSAWFNDEKNPTQPCFTAHGNKREYSQMLQRAFETLKKALVQYPEGTVVRFATEDNDDACDCAACRKLYKKYATNAAAEILFLNDLKRKTDEWFKSEDGKPYARDLKLVFYGYLAYVTPPVVKNGDTGEYEAADERVKCVDGVVPILCFIEATYSHSFYHEKNAKWADLTERWFACAKDIHFYFYDTNFHYMLTPLDTFSSMKENYRFVTEHNASFLHNLGQAKNPNPTGFSKLKVYLQSKLGWNVDADLEAYEEKFFKNAYGDGGEDMKKFYRSYREQAKKIHGELKFAERRNCECYGNPLHRKFWNEKLLNEWLGYTRAALEKIAPLMQTDVERYVAYVKNIVTERIFVKYLLVELYGDGYTETELESLKRSVKSDFEWLEFFGGNEANAFSLWTLWGLTK